MQDVAAQAGVSVMTVSNVLTGKKLVADSTRASVMQAIESLHYVPNIAARSLASAAPERIGVHFRNTENAFLSAMVIGAVDATSQMGAQMLVGRWDLEGDSSAMNVLRQLVRSGAQGVLIAPPFCEMLTEEDLAEFEGVALIGLSAGDALPRLPSVRIDDQRAAFDMTQRLIALGHRRIGFITGAPHHLSSGTRLAGYRQALQAAGLNFSPGLVADGDLTFDSGLVAMARLLDGPLRPTAVLASNDDMAAAAMAVAQRAGLRAPDDISVAGFDDSPLAVRVEPKLTSVRQPVSAMADQAVRLLIEAVRHPEGARPVAGQPAITHLVEHRLIERGSTGTAPTV
ncbi:LacI family DNA-binding transcriptional regulator [Brevundimonas sp.]|jgi:LacI family transcriptional regulator|uniref:LacI family DNA-binding transcriptional regulator n=1 Tax=Brevundimonas sp. TaxID=1871086 RepID=UPI0037C11532